VLVYTRFEVLTAISGNGLRVPSKRRAAVTSE